MHLVLANLQRGRSGVLRRSRTEVGPSERDDDDDPGLFDCTCREMVIRESGRFSRVGLHGIASVECITRHTRLLIKCSPPVGESKGACDGGVEGGPCQSL